MGLDISELYKNLYPKVELYVLKNSGSIDDAQDIFQEAVTAAWYNYRNNNLDFKNEKFEGYTFIIAKNKWIDVLRKNKKTNSFDLSIVPDNEEEYDEEKTTIQIEKLNNAFKQLGKKCQTILNLFYYKKESLKNIANQIGQSEDVIKTLKHRCMQNLRNLTK